MKSLKKYFAVFVAFTAFSAPSGVVRADEGAPPVDSSEAVKRVPAAQEGVPAPASDADKIRWKQALEDVKTERGVLLTLGIGGMVGGTVMYFGGYAENQSAASVPGCSRSGADVICDTAQHTQQAQDKIDSGKQGMLAGAVVLLAGAGVTWWGASKEADIRSLEREGRRKGFTWDIQIRRKNDVALLGHYKF